MLIQNIKKEIKRVKNYTNIVSFEPNNTNSHIKTIH
jgi:hypothetical protein